MFYCSDLEKIDYEERYPLLRTLDFVLFAPVFIVSAVASKGKEETMGRAFITCDFDVLIDNLEYLKDEPFKPGYWERVEKVRIQELLAPHVTKKRLFRLKEIKRIFRHYDEDDRRGFLIIYTDGSRNATHLVPFGKKEFELLWEKK